MKDWQLIAQCLRTELADYGGLLNLFEQQQQRAGCGDTENILNVATRIEAQARLVAQSRARREEVIAQFADEQGRPATASLRVLLSLIEPDARPLLKALMTEVNLLLHRVRRASRRTHTLLSRAAQAHHETLQHLHPHAPTRTGLTRSPMAGSHR